MLPVLLPILLLITIVAMVLKRRRRGGTEDPDTPGSRPETAIDAGNYHAMDEHILSLTCDCGGGFRPIGEGGLEHDGRTLRVARLECARCSNERTIYFVEPRLLH